jgi:uncharacterized paraquat-inducible protein A
MATKAALRSLVPEAKSAKLSAIVLVSICGNVGLNLYSDFGLSAQVMSNVPPTSRRRRLLESLVPSGGGKLRRLSSACDSNDMAIADDQTAAEQVTFGFPCAEHCALSGVGDGVCVAGCIATDKGLTATCSACYDAMGGCAFANCLSQCFTGLNDACSDCVQTSCVGALATCTGFTVAPPPLEPPSPPAAPPAGGVAASPPPASAPSPSWYAVGDVGDISYIESVAQAWDAGAYAVAIAVVLCSGFWPYMKNLLMLAAWFLPMSPTGRGQTLGWVNRLGSWGLLDVLVVCILVGLLEFELAGGAVKIRTEPRVAIVTFALASLWSIVQGEWMASLSARVASDKQLDEGDKMHLGCCGKGWSTASTTLSSQRGLWAWLVTSTLALITNIIGGVGPLVILDSTDITSGAMITTHIEESAFQVAGNLWPTGANTSPAPAALIALAYIIFALILPLLTNLIQMLAAAAMLMSDSDSPSKLAQSLLNLNKHVSPFAALDVLVVSTIVTVLEYGKFLESITESLVGQAGLIVARGQAGWGAYILLVSFLFAWVAMLLGAAQNAVRASSSSSSSSSSKTASMPTSTFSNQFDA